jgi:catechol 2,3-dioxygenase-like lactoylglutathione lyase family enzyme
MTAARLEHINFTVDDTKATAAQLCDLFGWKVRWEGDSMNGGYSAHVGTDTSYVALYSPRKTTAQATTSYEIKGGLNHIGVVVDDLDAMEQKVKDLGFETHSHADYEPGRRFYFHNHDNIEFEVVSYD